jgi:hypothetical protein
MSISRAGTEVIVPVDASSANGHKPVSGSVRAPRQARPPRLTKPRLTRVQTAQLVSLLDDLETACKRHVIYGSEHHPRVLAVYIVANYCRETDGTFLFPFWLYVYLRSRGTGHAKSRVLKIINALVADSSGILINPSEADLFRATHTGRMLLWDETPRSMRSAADWDLKCAILNSGNEQGGYVPRVNPKSGDLDKWSTFCPKVLAGRDVVRDLPDDVLRRTYVIDALYKPRARLELGRRWLPAEFESAVAAPLRDRLENWAMKALPVLRSAAAGLADMPVPDELYDSMAESWGPLLAVAGLAGRTWKDNITAAALADVPDETTETAANDHSSFELALRAAMERPQPFVRFADYDTGKRPEKILAGKPNGLTARSFGWARSDGVDPIGSLHHVDGAYELRVSDQDFLRLFRLVSKSAGQIFEPRTVLRELRNAGRLKTDGPRALMIKTRVWASQADQGPAICIDVTRWFAPNGTVNYLAPKTTKVSES